MSRQKPFPNDVLTCPNCGKGNDDQIASDLEEVLPRPGDLSMCAYCFQFNIYQGTPGENFTLRKATPEEVESIRKESPNEVRYAELMKIQLQTRNVKEN